LAKKGTRGRESWEGNIECLTVEGLGFFKEEGGGASILILGDIVSTSYTG